MFEAAAGFCGAASGLAKRPPSSAKGLVGLSAPGRGLGAVPRRSAKPGPRFSMGLVSSRGVVSLYLSEPAEPVGLVYMLLFDDQRPSSGYGGRVGLDGWLDRKSSSSGYGSGAAELEAPGGNGKVGLEADGAGYLKRSWLLFAIGFGL